MIETRLLLVIDYFKIANDEEDLQRALDFLAQKGFDRELKEEQKSAILQLTRGDLLGVLPTGFGKSLIFQLLAVAKKGSIVDMICPLISIMKDQVLEATSMGLTATAMAEAKQKDIDSGKYQLVFASAEDALQRKEFLASLKHDSSPLHNNLAVVVIDECHTILCLKQISSSSMRVALLAICLACRTEFLQSNRRSRQRQTQIPFIRQIFHM